MKFISNSVWHDVGLQHLIDQEINRQLLYNLATIWKSTIRYDDRAMELAVSPSVPHLKQAATFCKNGCFHTICNNLKCTAVFVCFISLPTFILNSTSLPEKKLMRSRLPSCPPVLELFVWLGGSRSRSVVSAQETC